MSNHQKQVRIFTTTNPQLLAMSRDEHRNEVFSTINSNKLSIDKSVFRNEDKSLVKRFKKTVTTPHRNKAKVSNSLSSLSSMLKY